MGLDIRFPIGIMFTLIGLILTVTGLFTGNDPAFYKLSLGININLVWGIVLLLFGGFMWGFAILEKRKSKKR